MIFMVLNKLIITMFIFLFVFSTFAEDISIKFQKQKWQILFQSIQSKF